jgi:hypothetical protein
MSRLLAIGTILIALLVSAIAPYQSALAQSSLRLITQFNLNNTSQVKFPQVATTGGTVHVTSNNDETDAYYFTKGETATSFGNPFRLGDADGAPDYSSAAVAAAPDGATYAIWINQDSKTIFLRRREANGSFGPVRTVDRDNSFPYNADVVVASDGAIYVAWLEPNRPVRMRRSTDQGASWSGRIGVSDTTGFRDVLDLAAGPNGQVAISFTGVIEPISVLVGIWNGSSFDTGVAGNNGASSGLNYGPDGKLYVAWRGVAESGGNSGMFYSERQANGSYPPSRLIGGSVTGAVVVDADSQNNIHFSWLSNAGRDPELYYAFKPAGAAIQNPIVASRDGNFLSNANGFASISDAAYFHVVTEAFTGGTSRVRYSLFAGGAVGTNANPLIEAGATLTRRGDNQVSVGFTVSGSAPNQVRWRWGAAPSDTQFDSPGAQGWTTYENPKLVAVPERIRNVCGEQVLYTQVRISGGATEVNAKSDGIIIDSVVTAPGALNAYNPYSFEANNDPIATTAVELAAGKANAGDPKHTRIDAVNIELDNSTDCSGLDNLVIGKTLTNLTSPDQIVNERFDKRVFFPTNSLTRGRNDFIIRVKDKAGNERDFPDTIFFDDEDPVLSTTAPGTITITLDPQATILADLSFSNINVTDLVYDKSGRKFWGVWLAVSRTATNPDTDSTLVWTPLAAPGTSNSFTIENFSLATGLPAGSLTPGDYFVYARFLDGAGNSTTGVINATTTLTEVTQPTTFLPLIRK